jgi:hypothetical protein
MLVGGQRKAATKDCASVARTVTDRERHRATFDIGGDELMSRVLDQAPTMSSTAGKI